MISRALMASTFAVLVGAPGLAQTVLDTPGAAGALIANACVSQSLDFEALLERATTIAEQIGLPQVTKSDTVAVFGDLSSAHVMFTREIDALACALTVPSPPGDEAYFATVRERMQAMISATYPTALSVANDDPSPHVDGHQWVFNNPRDRHFAVSLDWQRERGVMLGVGYRQIYE